MKPTSKFIFYLVCTTVLAVFTGCLGERYEANVPQAELDLWESDGTRSNSDDPGYGRPRFVRRNQSLPDRGSMPGLGQRGTLPSQRGSLPLGRGRNSTLPVRGSLPAITRGSLPR